MTYRQPLEYLDPVIERRRIWHWFHVEGMDTSEIARCLNVTESDAHRMLMSVLEVRQMVGRAK